MDERFQDHVTILMATYNGALYVEEQIDSLVSQTHTNWKLFVRDDGSTDDTIKIINALALKYNRIVLLEDGLGNLGSCQNFGALLKHAYGAQYVMFADQDDRWHPFKITETLNRMKAAEASEAEGTPILVHSDFTYADVNMRPLFSSPALFKNNRADLRNILVENHLYGCTMMLNQPLLKLSSDIPKVAENHDYWIALLATSLGKVEHVAKDTMLYRQHGANVSGSYKNRSIGKRLARLRDALGGFRKITNRRIEMVSVLYERHHAQMSSAKASLVADFLKWSDKGGFASIYQLRKLGITKGALQKDILFYISVFERNKGIYQH